jgi:hypothetical protein
MGLLRWMKVSLEEQEQVWMLAENYYLDPVFPVLLAAIEQLMIAVMNRENYHISFLFHMRHTTANGDHTAEEQPEHGKATCDYICHQNHKC